GHSPRVLAALARTPRGAPLAFVSSAVSSESAPDARRSQRITGNRFVNASGVATPLCQLHGGYGRGWPRLSRHPFPRKLYRRARLDLARRLEVRDDDGSRAFGSQSLHSKGSLSLALARGSLFEVRGDNEGQLAPSGADARRVSIFV